PTAKGQLTNTQTLAFSGALCAAGSALLYFMVNPLTMWLTFATFVGYAVIYTVVLKPLTPQNIVIGGASGAMPPVLGWAAIRGDVGPEALILFLIIFLWTPPHFWALALYRAEDYRKSGLPMLSVAAAALAAGCDKLGLPAAGGKASFNGVDITGADYRYALPDIDGRVRGNDDFKGKVTVVFFGYTQCPDVCPTTMAELAQVKK